MSSKSPSLQALPALLMLATVSPSVAFEARNIGPVLVSDATHGAEGTREMQVPEHKIGDLILKAPFARATLPNQPVAGAFLSIMNTGKTDDVLISVKSQVSGRSEIHEMAMVGDVMKMRALPKGLPIPAGEMVELKPGGYHLMFMDLNGPLVEGEAFDVTLEFEHAGEVTVTFSTMGKGAKTMDHSDHGS